ncbi:MAG: nitrate- and nitrite sensing domain-containing protein [Geodermatophilaceae bacterium]
MSGPPVKRTRQPAGDKRRPDSERAEPTAPVQRPAGARFPHARTSGGDARDSSSGARAPSIYGGKPVGARFHARASVVSTVTASKGGWRLRNWRLRSRLVVLLVIPLVLAGVLGGLRVASAVGEIQSLNAVQGQVALSERVATVVDSLQTERKLAAAAATTEDSSERALVEEQIGQADADVASMLDLQSESRPLEGTSAGAYVEVLRSLGETSIPSSGNTLPKLRELVSAPGTSVDTVMSLYTEVIAILLKFNRVALSGTAADANSLVTAISYMAEAKEQVSVQHALLLSASLEGVATESQQSQLRNSIAGFDAAITNFSETPISSAQRRVYFDTYTGAPLDDRKRFLDIGLAEPNTAPLDSIATEWDEAASTIQTMLRTVETSLIDDVKESTSAASDVAITDAIRDASIIALLLLFTLILLVLVARSVLRPLLALRTSALDVAQRRLPALVEQLRRPGGWKDDVQPVPMVVHTGEDIGQVARAFDEVHREAVRLATEQAMMRSTVNDMFVNLSRRSQSMVERQLRIIDALESGERDPEALSELFRLDHLATRMRRNNENLLVLAGSETRQRTGAARPILDVLRGAISEIEEYQRITIESVPDAAIVGVAVNDLVHLTAELLDNATNFSPKDAQVVLSSSLQPDGGMLIEIRDTGVGMSATQRNAINDRLATPPMVDVSVSRHMGLFVVGRLAARHGISVRMQATGSEGGLTAAVSVPNGLISPEVERPAQVSQPAAVANGSTAVSGVGAMFDAAPSGAVAPARPGQAADNGRNGAMVPAGIAAASNGTGNGAQFDAAITQALDFSLDAVSSRSQAGLDLFASSQPAEPGDAHTTDFFATLPTADSLSQGQGEGTPIFQEMRSAWFSQKPAAVSGAADSGESDRNSLVDVEGPASDFGSSADQGWQAAEQLRTPVDAGTTRAGLPRRRPRAHLVPGGTARPAAETSPSAAGRMNNVTLLRDAERVRGNLSSYQRGTRRGRHSSPMEDAERSMGEPRRNEVGRHGEVPTSQERQ